MLPLAAVSAVPISPPASPNDDALRKAAMQLESVFLAEMLKPAGLAETPEAFGGGAGEEQFASFLRQAQADAMVKAGGIGLAEALFDSMSRVVDDAV